MIRPAHTTNEIEKFEALFREIPAALALLRGSDFIFEKVNDEYLKLVGRQDILGKKLLDVLPELKEQAFPDILRKVFETGETFQAREVEALLQMDPTAPGKLTSVFLDLTYRRISDSEGKPYGVFAFVLDVTEKVLSRSEVQLEQQKLEAVFANASASLALLRGANGVYEKVNPSYQELLSGRKLIGKPIIEALPELKGQKFPSLVAQVFSTGKPYIEIEAQAFLRRNPDSPLERRFFDQSYIRITDPSNTPYGVLIQAIDVTERVNNRRERAENDERFRIAIDAAKMGTWEMNMQTQMLEWSPRTYELFGISPTEKLHLDNALGRVHPEDRARLDSAMNRAVDPHGDGNFIVDYRVIHRDSKIIWVSVRGKAFFENSTDGNVITRFSGTVLDITDRKLSEEALRGSERQFRMMADGMPQVVWTARPDGVLDYTNERWHQYSGSSEPEKWLDYVHSEDLVHVVESWTDSVKTGKVYETEFRLRRASDQTYRWFLARAQPSFDSHGKIERWFGTCTDIEDQRAALAARSEFMSIASHELKTPLTSLKLQTQSMQRNFKKGRTEAFSLEKVGALVNNNEKQIGRLVRLVDDMLDFEKIESGKLSMTKESSDLCELVREVYERLKEQLDAADCESQLECQGVVRGLVDRFRIEQVITNLITNAIRYGNSKPVALKVMNRSGKILISVADQGIGIAPEHQQRIFKRFERVSSANEVEGLGLGLFITQQIIEAHQGKIWVESKLGQGSTFFVELPSER
jgi:PAS domain S-box-containing protein